MLELYVTLVKAGIRTLDSVPAAFREKVKAAIEGDPNLVFQAVLYDPLTSAVCSMDEIQNMVQEMLDKNAEYLGYFKSLKINMEVLHEKENR